MRDYHENAHRIIAQVVSPDRDVRHYERHYIMVGSARQALGLGSIRRRNARLGSDLPVRARAQATGLVERIGEVVAAEIEMVDRAPEIVGGLGGAQAGLVSWWCGSCPSRRSPRSS